MAPEPIAPYPDAHLWAQASAIQHVWSLIPVVLDFESNIFPTWRRIFVELTPRHQVNLIVILMTFVCFLYSINCPIVICLPSMLFILWRDTSSELWTPVPSFTFLLPFYDLLALFKFSQTTIFYHTIRLILCLQQTGEIDNLTVSWGKVLWLCCVQVPRC
jgi:hypothetical protein